MNERLQTVPNMDDEQLTVMRSMAGIPKSMHDVKLTDFGTTGELLKDWVLSEGFEVSLNRGEGWQIYGGDMAIRAAYSLTRAALMRGARAQILHLPLLVETLEDRTERLAEIYECDFLAVTDFCTTASRGVFPFGDAVRARVEGLLRYMMMDGVSMVLQGDLFRSTWAHSNDGWYSDAFTQLITRHMQTITIGDNEGLFNVRPMQDRINTRGKAVKTT